MGFSARYLSSSIGYFWKHVTYRTDVDDLCVRFNMIRPTSLSFPPDQRHR